MILKPQDVVVSLKHLSIREEGWSYNKLALDLGMSPSEVHAATKRAIRARLLVEHGDRIAPYIRNLEEFLLHGLSYVYVAEVGGSARGILTGFSAPVLQRMGPSLASSAVAYVWPSVTGEARGQSVSPLYRSVPVAVRNDSKLYVLLALVDALRVGRAREREIASDMIGRELRGL